MTWLAILLALPILLSACGGGVSQEEFDAVKGDLQAAEARVQSLETQVQTAEAQVQSLETQVQKEQARVQEVEAQAAALQHRLDRGAAIQEVLGILISSFEDEGGGPSAEDILELTAVIQASGDPALQAKWVEIIDSILASAGPPPQEALSQAAAVVQASGNVQVAEKWQEFLAAAARGEGGAVFLELGALIQASGDPALQALLVEIVGATLVQGEPPDELFGEFSALVLASGNVEVQEAFQKLGGPPAELFEEVGTKLQALGDPTLVTLFEAAVQSPSEEAFDAFFEGLLEGLRETLR